MQNIFKEIREKYPSWSLATKLQIWLSVLFFILGILVTQVYYNLSNLSSIKSGEKLNEIANSCKEASFYSASCVSSKSNYSREEVIKIINQFQGDSTKYYQLGKAQLVLGNLSGAQEFFIKSLNNSFPNFEVYYDLGWISYQLGDFGNSIYYCQKYLDIVPSDIDCQQGIALSSISLQNYTSAEEVYSSLIPIFKGGLIQSLDNRAYLYGKFGLYSKAIEDLLVSVQLSPWECRYTELAGYSMLGGDYINGTRYFEEAKKLNPNYKIACTTGLPEGISRDAEMSFGK